MMDSLKDLIERCHQRHNKPIRQRKTVVKPATYNLGYPHQHIIYCARNSPVRLHDIELADISFMPIGRAPKNDHGPRSVGSKQFLERQGIRNWAMAHWDKSWGIQVYTGIPSERDGARWHDLDFTYQAVCAASDAVYACIAALVNAVENPLLTLSKSVGSDSLAGSRITSIRRLRWNDSIFINIHRPQKTPHRTEIYLKILGEHGHNPWDARYEILLGNLLDPPLITKELFFGPIEALRERLFTNPHQRRWGNWSRPFRMCHSIWGRISWTSQKRLC